MCALIPSPRLVTRTRLCLVIHRAEVRKPTNTGVLATECLANSHVLVRGHQLTPNDRFQIPDGVVTQPVLLFPHEGAIDLTAFARSSIPITLVVPDGNWRQASKVRQRVHGLDQIPCVTLPRAAPSTYRLRSEAHDTGLATVEAIARAFGILEGPQVEAALDRVFCAMVERTLWARGEIDACDVKAGIPAGVERHDPTSGVPAAPLR